MLQKALVLVFALASVAGFVSCGKNASHYVYATVPAASQLAVFREAEKNYEASTGERIAHWQRRLLARYSRNLALAELMRRIGARHGRSAGEVAIAWTLRHPAVTAAIVGMRSAEQAKGVMGALEFRLSPEEIAQIDQARSAGML